MANESKYLTFEVDGTEYAVAPLAAAYNDQALIYVPGDRYVRIVWGETPVPVPSTITTVSDAEAKVAQEDDNTTPILLAYPIEHVEHLVGFNDEGAPILRGETKGRIISIEQRPPTAVELELEKEAILLAQKVLEAANAGNLTLQHSRVVNDVEGAYLFVCFNPQTRYLAIGPNSINDAFGPTIADIQSGTNQDNIRAAIEMMKTVLAGIQTT